MSSRARTGMIAALDQAWSHARDAIADIKRIADDGPRQTEADCILVQAVFSTVQAQLLVNAYDVEHQEPRLDT